MIITSNRPPQDWVLLFPDAVMANSALDRLAHHAHHIIIEGGESYRKKWFGELTNAFVFTGYGGHHAGSNFLAAGVILMVRP